MTDFAHAVEVALPAAMRQPAQGAVEQTITAGSPRRLD